ncbi:MAG TPA: GIY-YIG nuclease family protein [Cyclobacteriaceae bacterium]|nr:GIY-YIG nuclease family protein [Cyclobacteriaceae bacterium]
MIYYVYIIESETSHKWYIGFTSDLDARLANHNHGLNASTKGRGPWKYIFQRPVEGRKQAREFEKYLKAARNKSFIRKKFEEFFLLACPDYARRYVGAFFFCGILLVVLS